MTTNVSPYVAAGGAALINYKVANQLFNNPVIKAVIAIASAIFAKYVCEQYLIDAAGYSNTLTVQGPQEKIALDAEALKKRIGYQLASGTAEMGKPVAVSLSRGLFGDGYYHPDAVKEVIVKLELNPESKMCTACWKNGGWGQVDYNGDIKFEGSQIYLLIQNVRDPGLPFFLGDNCPLEGL